MIMGEAAPQAADRLSVEDARLLEVLRMLWDGVYTIGYDAEKGWWASRDGVAGHLITATDAEELGKALADDYGDSR